MCAYLQFPLLVCSSTLQLTKQKPTIPSTHPWLSISWVIIPRRQGSSEIFAEELQLRRGKGAGNLIDHDTEIELDSIPYANPFRIIRRKRKQLWFFCGKMRTWEKNIYSEEIGNGFPMVSVRHVYWSFQLTIGQIHWEMAENWRCHTATKKKWIGLLP